MDRREKQISMQNRIKSILEKCDNKAHSFVIEHNGCVDCSVFPSVEFDGDKGSIDRIYIDRKGNVVVHGRTEWDGYDRCISDLYFEEITEILNTLEEQLGLEVSPTFNKDAFHITSVCREDITALGYKGAENISDSVMEKIAQKMCDAYVANSFWSALDFFVGEYCELEKEESETEDED